MRKLIITLIAVLTLTVTAFSQTFKVADNGTFTQVYQRIAGGLNLYVPHGSNPTLNSGKDSTGAVYFKVNALSDTSFYMKMAGGSWLRFPNYNKIQSMINAAAGSGDLSGYAKLTGGNTFNNDQSFSDDITVGNTITAGSLITGSDIRASKPGPYAGGGSLVASNATSQNSVILTADAFSFFQNSSNKRGYLFPQFNPSSDISWVLPSTGGYLATKVNGVAAGTDGNITIGALPVPATPDEVDNSYNNVKYITPNGLAYSGYSTINNGKTTFYLTDISDPGIQPIYNVSTLSSQQSYLFYPGATIQVIFPPFVDTGFFIYQPTLAINGQSYGGLLDIDMRDVVPGVVYQLIVDTNYQLKLQGQDVYAGLYKVNYFKGENYFKGINFAGTNSASASYLQQFKPHPYAETATFYPPVNDSGGHTFVTSVDGFIADSSGRVSLTHPNQKYNLVIGTNTTTPTGILTGPDNFSDAFLGDNPTLAVNSWERVGNYIYINVTGFHTLTASSLNSNNEITYINDLWGQIKTANDYAVANSGNLLEANFPGVRTLGTGVFASCTAMTSISLTSAKNFGGGTFSNCPALVNIISLYGSLDIEAVAAANSITADILVN